MQQAVIQHPFVQNIETRLIATGEETIEFARSLRITDDGGYAAAAEFLREIKRRAKDIADYWADPKAKALEAHRGIVAKEKAMATPLIEAESIVKNNMTAYQREAEAKRRAQEAEVRRKQQEERDRLLAEAASADQLGDIQAAETSLFMAEMVEDMRPAVMQSAAPKAAGVSTRKTWKARVVDESKVPACANGVVIRPIDLPALNNIARLTKGTANIPGIEFYEDSSITVR